MVEYCTDFVCTYTMIEEINDSNMLFRSQYLQAFKLESFDLEVINSTSEKLFALFQDNEKYKLDTLLANLYDKHAKQLIPFGFHKNYANLFTFQILFSYDYFNKFHLCLIELINNNKIGDVNFNNLIELINSSTLENMIEHII